MRSETTHIPSCTCWLCRVSTPPATRLLLERATRLVPLLLSSADTPVYTNLSLFRCDQCSRQTRVCNWFPYFQLLRPPDASNGPAAFNLMTFVFIWGRCNCFLSGSFLFLEAPGLLFYIQIFHTSLIFVFQSFFYRNPFSQIHFQTCTYIISFIGASAAGGQTGQCKPWSSPNHHREIHFPP